MPDDRTPGPEGPHCVRPRAAVMQDEPAGRSEPGVIARRIERDEGTQAIAPRSAGLAAPHEPTRATTADPHVHERWDEARKLELSYCINFVSGEDAERAANYHKLIRSLVATTAEWERVSDVNFIHLRQDDEPDTMPHVTSLGGGRVHLDAARCHAGTKAFFSVVPGFYLGNRDGVTNVLPQTWNDPVLEPYGSDALPRILQINSSAVAELSDFKLLSTLRHELGHVMGFVHEEAGLEEPPGECDDPDPRLLTPVDSASIMGTPDCVGLSDADYLSARDRLSAFFLHHTPRSRFELRGASPGYRFGGGPLAAGAEILWHTAGAMEGVRWRFQGGAGISFAAGPYPYVPPGTPLPAGWYPSQSEVVIPLRLGGDPDRFDLLFFGPGPDVDDFAVLTTTGSRAVLPWDGDAFAVPVVGRFDSTDLDRDVVYLYRPGPDADSGLSFENGAMSMLEDVPQQDAHAYPLAAPYRGPELPDDVLWHDPVAGQVIAWRWVGNLGAVATAVWPQASLSLPRGELVPAVGDFNGDDKADVLWHGVAHLPTHENTTDALWLSDSTADAIGFVVIPKSVGTGYRPFVGDFDGDGRDDVFWHRQWGMTSTGPSETDTGPSFAWYFDEDGGHEAKAYVLGGDYSPYVGDFDGDGCHDIGWFDAPNDALHVWRCIPAARDFDCGQALDAPPGAAPVGVHWGF